MSDFDALFPQFAAKAGALYGALVPVAAVLCFTGLTIAAIRAMHGDMRCLFGKLVAVAVIAAALSNIDTWANTLMSAVVSLVDEQIQANPAEVSARFGTILAEPANQNGQSFWEKVFNPQTAVAEAVGQLLIWCIGKVAWLIRWWAFIIQKAAYYLTLSLAPIFLGMMAVDSFRQIGTKYLLGIVSIIVWPVGWAVADIMTDGLLRNAADKQLVNSMGGAAGSNINAWQTYTFILAASIWIIFSAICAPGFISWAIVSGGSFAVSMMSGAAKSTARVAGMAASAISTGATAGASGGGSAVLATATSSSGNLSAGIGSRSAPQTPADVEAVAARLAKDL